jgi:NAD(P)-dependent dehydrogenase (short-subunit alcohol dehydrogenase family)
MDKKVILISGANSNIGSNLAKSFLDDGFSLLLLVHQKQNHLHNLLSIKDRVFHAECNLSNWADTYSAVHKIITTSSLVPYGLIHAATVRSNDSLNLVESDPEKWANIININILSAFHLIKAVIPYMIQQHEGKIVLFGSEVSRNGLARGTAYAASKSAISNMSRSLALELADSGILINTLSPGPVETAEDQFEPEYRNFRNEYFENQKRNIPLGRVTQISDIYPLCKFLVSEENSYLTGEEIFLTGGKI